MYPSSRKLDEQLVGAFTYHPPYGNQTRRYEEMRAKATALADFIAHNTPESREQSLALTKLQEVVMWANAAIAVNEIWDGNHMLAPLDLIYGGQQRG